MKHAKPAARGHRAHTTNGKKAWGLGGAIFNPLRDAAIKRGLRFHRYAEARQLAVDANDRVVGVKVLQIPADGAAAKKYGRLFAIGSKWLAALPPSFPLSVLTIGLGRWYLSRAKRIETRYRQTRWIQARKGLALSAGGFIMNPAMVRHYAPHCSASHPNGTLGDDGSGIVLGATAGGALSLMGRISAWRFINPPKAWTQGILINQRGERFVNETLYGASIGEAMMQQPGGKAWILLDAKLRAEAKEQAKDPRIVPFQRDVAKLNLAFNARKANTLDELAALIGFDPATLRTNVERYNQIARGEIDDPHEKRTTECAVIGEGPYYAIDASVDSKLLPLPTMTVGGLKVDESSGQVLNDEGKPIAGLYAAGRSAVGICSNIYVSGLSFADCVFSGRRVARHLIASRD